MVVTAATVACSKRPLAPQTLISVIVPCYNEEEVLPELYDRLSREAQGWGTDYEVILVDDGSVDRTWDIINELHAADPRWKAIRLGRNFGHQTALRAGLHAVRGNAVAILDADLQDPPEVLRDFLLKWSQGYDVVYGVRTKRKEGLLQRSAYHLFYRLLAFLAEMDVPLEAGDFSLMDRRVVEILKRMQERKPYLRGLRSWVGYRQYAFEYERQHRAAGRTKYNFKRLFGLAIDGILSTSIVPLRLATLLGATVSCVAFLGAVFTLALKLFPGAFRWLGMEAIPGTATVVISVLFIGGVQLLCLGIFGEYLGRIFENVKARPLWTVGETLGVPDPSPDEPPNGRTLPPSNNGS
jgi:dolichol-phosphate mannosyltransferase